MYIEISLCMVIISMMIVSIVRNHSLRKDDKSVRDAIKSGIFSISEPVDDKNLMIACMGVFSIMIIIVLFSFYRQGYMASNVIFLCFFFFLFMVSLLLFLRCYNWRISVEKDKIVYKNFWGQVKNYNFQEIEVLQDKNYNVLVYQNNKKIFSINSDIAGADIFLVWARNYDVYKGE